MIVVKCVASVADLTNRHSLHTCCRCSHAGLGFMHKLDILHCDIKPANMFLHRLGTKLIGKLGDLGLARELLPTPGVPCRLGMPTRGMPTRGYRGVLKTTESWGTLEYMAPECRKSQVSFHHVALLHAVCLYMQCACLDVHAVC
jgi:serine/threonine protein kinase